MKEGLNSIQPDTYTLPRRSILRGKSRFQRLFNQGKQLNGRFTGLRYLVCEEEASQPLMAFIVRKKLGNAVLRNHLKRLMREAYRTNQHLLKPVTDAGFTFHGALIARQSDADYASVERECRWLLHSVTQHILNNRSEKS